MRSNIITNLNKSVIVHVCFVLFIVCLYTCVCECLLENNNHKTKHKIILIAGVPLSQALPGYLITAPPSVCLPDVIGALACGFQTKEKKTMSPAGLRFLRESFVFLGCHVPK